MYASCTFARPQTRDRQVIRAFRAHRERLDLSRQGEHAKRDACPVENRTTDRGATLVQVERRQRPPSGLEHEEGEYVGEKSKDQHQGGQSSLQSATRRAHEQGIEDCGGLRAEPARP